MNLYNCRASIIPGGGFIVTKFDGDMNPLIAYDVTNNTCTCPAGARPTCKHRKMLGKFFERKHVDDGWFYCAENGMWHRPLNEPADEVKHPRPAIPAEPSVVPAGFKRRV